MPFLDQLPNVATGTPRRRAASCPPTDAASLIASALNSCVYCLLGSLPSFISILRTFEVSNFLLYVKSRQGHNDWLQQACVKAWAEMSHPEWTQLTVADVWQDERARLMPNPRAFDGYVEQPVRVSATALIHFQRNRYSVPCEWIHAVVSLRAYADGLLVVGPDGRQVRLARSFERDQTLYDWMHYIALIERKPGALRNGAPFKTMPEPLQEMQRQLLRHSGGDRVMAQVLMGVSLHGLEAVVVAVELALQSGRVSAEHVLNVLSRLKEQRVPEPPVATMLKLNTPPLANLQRYDALRNVQPHEASPESDHA